MNAWIHPLIDWLIPWLLKVGGVITHYTRVWSRHIITLFLLVRNSLLYGQHAIYRSIAYLSLPSQHSPTYLFYHIFIHYTTSHVFYLFSRWRKCRVLQRCRPTPGLFWWVSWNTGCWLYSPFIISSEPINPVSQVLPPSRQHHQPWGLGCRAYPGFGEDVYSDWRGDSWTARMGPAGQSAGGWELWLVPYIQAVSAQPGGGRAIHSPEIYNRDIPQIQYVIS